MNNDAKLKIIVLPPPFSGRRFSRRLLLREGCHYECALSGRLCVAKNLIRGRGGPSILMRNDKELLNVFFAGIGRAGPSTLPLPSPPLFAKGLQHNVINERDYSIH